MIVEGAYPYVTGGVSSWIQDFIQHFDEHDFIIQTIVADRSKEPKFAYKIPSNVLEIRESYLLDNDLTVKTKKVRLSKKERGAFQSLLYGQDVEWELIFRYFVDHEISLNDFLASEVFMELSREHYEANYPEEVFVDFLWTMRSMFLPLFSILTTKLPKADVYHTISTGYAGILGSMAKVLYGKPLLLSEHGIYTREREEEIIRAGWVNGIYKNLWIQSFKKYSSCCYRYADRVTALFEEAKQLQVEFGCDERKIRVVHNGIDVSQYAGLPGKQEGDPWINVGAILRITPIKDVKTMISAFASAKKDAPKLKLWIMGPDGENAEYVEECKELIRIYGVKDIIFTGRIQVKEYIGKMDILILTSISEGQPLVILEGFAARKPFICTNVGNCKGLLEGEGGDSFGKAGIITPVMKIEELRAALVYLARHKDVREAMGEIGYQRADRYYRTSDLYHAFQELYDALEEAGS